MACEMSAATQAEQQGFAANERHDYAAARMHFLEAYSISSQPQHAFSAANMCLKIGTPENRSAMMTDVYNACKTV